VLTGVVEIDSADGRHTVSRQVDGYREVYTVTGPAALTIRPEMAQHKETALGGLAVAFDEMPVERLTLGDVGLLPEQVGDAGSPTRVRAIRPISKSRMCRRLEGTPVEQAEALVRHLAENGLIG
jgi:electron transfer flavoprotein beta subunit